MDTNRTVRTGVADPPLRSRNVMLTRHNGQLKLKDRAFAIPKGSTMRKARVALTRRLAIIMHAMLRDGREFASTSDAREGADDCADCVALSQLPADCVFNLAALHPAYSIKHQPSAQRANAPEASIRKELLAWTPLENNISSHSVADGHSYGIGTRCPRGTRVPAFEAPTTIQGLSAPSPR
jgi:hypothetical protein